MPILPKSYVNFAQKSALFYRSVNFIFGKKIVPQDILTPVRPSFFCLFLYYFPLFANSAFICHAASASLFFPYPHRSFCAQVRRSKRKILPSFTPKGMPLPCKKTRPSPPIAKKAGPFLSAKTYSRIPQARLSFTLVADTAPAPHKRGRAATFCIPALRSPVPFRSI